MFNVNRGRTIRYKPITTANSELISLPRGKSGSEVEEDDCFVPYIIHLTAELSTSPRGVPRDSAHGDIVPHQPISPLIY